MTDMDCFKSIPIRKTDELSTSSKTDSDELSRNLISTDEKDIENFLLEPVDYNPPPPSCNCSRLWKFSVLFLLLVCAICLIIMTYTVCTAATMASNTIQDMNLSAFTDIFDEMPYITESIESIQDTLLKLYNELSTLNADLQVQETSLTEISTGIRKIAAILQSWGPEEV